MGDKILPETDTCHWISFSYVFMDKVVFSWEIHPEMRGHHEHKYQCLIVYRFSLKDRLQIPKADLNSDSELWQNSRMLVTGCQTEELRSHHSVVDSLTAVDVFVTSMTQSVLQQKLSGST